MRRLTGILGLAVAAVAALFLFAVKQDVRQMEDELRVVHRGILNQQEAIQVLETEWSYLNQPARIADLAKRHLGLEPISATRIVRLSDLPRRAESAEPASKQISPAAAVDDTRFIPALSNLKARSAQ
jgi:cell division protein FtsL